MQNYSIIDNVIREQQVGYSDFDPNSPEFISNDETKRVVMEAVRGRLEPDSKTVASVMTRRRKIYDASTGEGWVMGPKIDPVEYKGPLILCRDYNAEREMPNGDIVLEHAGRTDLACAIYDSMTGRCKRAFSFDDIEVINDGLRNLANALEQAGYEEGGVKLGQLVPSFQFESSKDGELPPTRLYLHRTDLSSLRIAADLINSGARPDYGKFWIPYGREGIQKYRQDTFILGFSEYHDLEEAVELLRKKSMQDDEVRMGAGDVLYGLKIAGILGAYIGQSKHRGGSFNGEITQYFEEAIQCACENVQQPQTGEILTDEWLDTMARKTTDALGSIMSKNGRTVHHALIDSDTTVDLIKLAGGVQ